MGRYGSIVIDGVHYATNSALIRINGAPAQKSDLRVGNRVMIRGDMTANEAWTVDYYETLAGTLNAISVDDEVLQSVEVTTRVHSRKKAGKKAGRRFQDRD